MQLPLGRCAPAPGMTPGQSSGLVLTMMGMSRRQSPGQGGLDPLTEECPGEDRQCLQAQEQAGIPGKFPGQVLSLPETSHSISVCFTVQWLATSRTKVTVQFVKNTHPIICWIIFILYFPGLSSPGRNRTTHLNEESQSGNTFFLLLPAFSQKVPCEGSDLPLKGISQSSL